jgi:hypothetical protein
MMADMNQIDPNHQQTRARLHKGGLFAVIIGGPCALIGVVLFLSVFFTAPGSHDMDSQGRRAVTGLIMAGVGGFATVIGLNLLGFAHMGKIARFQAGQTMPVAKDMLRDASPVFNDLARGISQSIRGDAGSPGKVRHSCGAWNDAGDKYCKGCGASLAAPVCPKCSAPNDPDARFCEKCGAALAAAGQV